MGKWEGIDTNEEIGGIHFIDSVNIVLSIPDQQATAEPYSIDAGKNPICLFHNSPCKYRNATVPLMAQV